MSDSKRTLRGETYTVIHTVGTQTQGIRLDLFLKARYRKRSREQLKDAVESGAIWVTRDSKKNPHMTIGKLRPSTLLFSGDLVHVESIRKPEPPVNFDYQILFENDDYCVCNKPANLPVHPAGRYFFNTLLIHLKSDGFRKDLEAEKIFYLVHRIDKETSGILLLAKTLKACHSLTAQFKNRETEKSYLAIVRGQPKEKKFRVDQPIGKNPKSKIGLRMYPLTEEDGGFPSITDFEWIETRQGRNPEHGEIETYSLMRCKPLTGRQHQIRVHAEFAGIPLVGDKIYGMNDEDTLLLLDHGREETEFVADDEVSDDVSESFNEDDSLTPVSERFDAPTPSVDAPLERILKNLRIPRHALHAESLSFLDPISGKRVQYQSGLPKDLKEFWDSLTS